MNKELPKMYQNKISKKKDGIQKVYSTLYQNNDTQVRKPSDKKPVDGFTIEQKIYHIFNSRDYIYKVDVYIETDEGITQKRIVGKNKQYLITMDNEYIPINKIKDIYR